MNEGIKLSGAFKLDLYDEKGSLKSSEVIRNTIVTAGKNFLATWLAASSQASPFMPYIALGTGTTAASTADTALETELTTRVAGTISSSSNIWQISSSFGPGVDTGAVTEAGIFSASSSGTMLARQVFSARNKGAGDTLVITWSITFS